MKNERGRVKYDNRGDVRRSPPTTDKHHTNLLKTLTQFDHLSLIGVSTGGHGVMPHRIWACPRLTPLFMH